MLTTLMAGVIALGLAQQQTDTTFAMRAGGLLDIDAMGGSATIRSWDRESVRIRASHERAIQVEIRQSGRGVRVEAERRDGGPASTVRYEITVPRRSHIRIDGVNMSADVQDVHGNVDIENVEGAINVRNVTGNVVIESVAGGLVIEDIAGNVNATTVNQSIRINRVRGAIMAETVNGSIVMTAADADRVRASTVNGIIEYDGVVRDGGRYFLGTHNGRLTMTIPEAANASLRISSGSGRVEAAFPVSLTSTRSNRFAATVGTGSADVQLQSFNGVIRLVRPGRR